MKNKALTILWYGFLTWLVPFVVSFGFFNQSGQLAIEESLFKSIMVVVGVATAVFLLKKYLLALKKVKNTLNEGLVVGLSWFAINSVLDFVTLINGFGMPVLSWVYGIGVRYLAIVIISVGMASLLKKK